MDTWTRRYVLTALTVTSALVPCADAQVLLKAATTTSTTGSCVTTKTVGFDVATNCFGNKAEYAAWKSCVDLGGDPLKCYAKQSTAPAPLVAFPVAPAAIRELAGFQRYLAGSTVVITSPDLRLAIPVTVSATARQAAIGDLVGRGCRLLTGNSAGVFCTTVDQFNAGFAYLKAGTIDDVQAELASASTVTISEYEDATAQLVINSTPVLRITRGSDLGSVTGTAGFTLTFRVPVLGASPRCPAGFPMLTEDQYLRRLVDQQNYVVQTRKMGLWSYSTSADDGVVRGQIEVSEADVVRAVNYAKANNAWGQSFSLTLLAKAGPTFIFHDPACTATPVAGGTSYRISDDPLVRRPYRMVPIQMQVIAGQ